MLRFGVAGDPVAHSKSPQMHMAAFRELGIDADYQRLPIPAGLFEETVRALPASGFSGINVTIPHKESALAVADDVSDAAAAIGAANTLAFVEGEIRAYNTDAPGLISALSEGVAAKRALVLGAGGTARAAVWALKHAGAAVGVWNRTASRAAVLADEFSVKKVEAPAEFAGAAVVVNTTSVGMGEGEDEASVLDTLGLELAALDPSAVVVDFVYRTGGSPLTLAAHAAGLKVVDGLDLLAAQGALSFEIWHHRDAPLATMRAALD